MSLDADYGIGKFLSVVSQVNGERLVVYGNSGYRRRNFVVIPYEGGNLEPWESTLNIVMTNTRIIVEWFSKEVKA